MIESTRLASYIWWFIKAGPSCSSFVLRAPVVGVLAVGSAEGAWCLICGFAIVVAF